jgi:hypothetical protein
VAKGPPFEQRVPLAAALANRLNSLLPPEVRVVADPDASMGVWSEGWWGGIDLAMVDYESIESLAEYALSSLQDNVAHAVNGAWPPVGALRLNLPWFDARATFFAWGSTAASSSSRFAWSRSASSSPLASGYTQRARYPLRNWS